MSPASPPIRLRLPPACDRRRGAGATLAFVAACAVVQPTSAAGPTWQVPGGDAERGARWIREVGCAGCHTIPGIRGANANVGPPLTRIADRTYIAGMLRNTPENLVRWIRQPQSVVPGNAMPNMGLSEAQARDIAAYLYRLR